VILISSDTILVRAWNTFIQTLPIVKTFLLKENVPGWTKNQVSGQNFAFAKTREICDQFQCENDYQKIWEDNELLRNILYVKMKLQSRIFFICSHAVSLEPWRHGRCYRNINFPVSLTKTKNARPHLQDLISCKFNALISRERKESWVLYLNSFE